MDSRRFRETNSGGEAVKIARHIPDTMRQFKARKRREFRAIVKAFEVYKIGCAYAPYQTGALDQSLRDGVRQLSVKQWGR